MNFFCVYAFKAMVFPNVVNQSEVCFFGFALELRDERSLEIKEAYSFFIIFLINDLIDVVTLTLTHI